MKSAGGMHAGSFVISKADPRYWVRRLVKWHGAPNYGVQIQFRGRRLTFTLRTANKDSAAKRAAAICSMNAGSVRFRIVWSFVVFASACSIRRAEPKRFIRVFGFCNPQPAAPVFDFRAHSCHSAPMETHAFGFRLPANAPEGQKRFPIVIRCSKDFKTPSYVTLPRNSREPVSLTRCRESPAGYHPVRNNYCTHSGAG
jgi:hypothetical protein